MKQDTVVAVSMLCKPLRSANREIGSKPRISYLGLIHDEFDPVITGQLGYEFTAVIGDPQTGRWERGDISEGRFM